VPENIMDSEKSISIKSHDLNIQFLSPLEMNMQITNNQRVQSWSLLDDIEPMDEMLKDEVERKLNDIDAGKEKLTRYSNVNEYLKHVDEVLNE